MTSRPRQTNFWPFNCFLDLDFVLGLNCVCAHCTLLKYFIIEKSEKISCLCGGGPYVVEAPVHWHIVHMPKSGPGHVLWFTFSKEWVQEPGLSI